jgi:acyl-CoA ligase (AMP-forming) (exosortase A-associated)
VRHVDDLVRDSASRFGSAPALTFRLRTLSYAELWDQVDAVAAGLVRAGLGRGERVAVYAEKRLETVVGMFGTSRAGGVFVPVNPALRSRQVAYILADCSVRVLVTTSARLADLADHLRDCPHLQVVVCLDEPAEGSAAYRVVGWDSLFGPREDPEAAERPDVIDADVAAILYTSGSTGMPKGVVLSHRNVLVGAESVSEYLGMTQEDVILSALPLSFDAGFSQLTTSFHVGAHVVLMNYLLPRDVPRLVAQHRVTGLTCVPPLWIQIADVEWPPEARAAMRFFANTGGRMPRTTLDRLRGLFPSALPFLMYGLTEAFRSTYLDPAQVDLRPDSIGKAIPNAEILVVRPDGTVCDDDEPGELVHRGPLVALGYWNDPERTAERFRPSPGGRPELSLPEIAVWSGDYVVRDPEGFLRFVGRRDEMIKTSGYRVSPTEVEEAVYDTGLVSDAVALGVEDPALGQRVVVVVAPPTGGAVDSGALVDALRSRLPLFMVPREVVVKDTLPRSPNGKFDRTALREELAR